MSLSAPFPWFGGKRRAAPIIWRLLGDPGGYIEPFAGSAAVLLARPPFKGRRVETLNDADGWLTNLWRAIQTDPEGVTRHVIGPVSEIDYHARLAWLQERRGEFVAWLEGHPEHVDVKAAGWWLYVVCCGIADPFGPGPWRTVGGHLRKLPHLGDAGRGVNRKLPHLGDAGRGVNRELPHLGNAGQGVNRELPHLGNAGQGVHDLLTALSNRLHRVRITTGDWQRVLTPAASRATTGGDGTTAILLDPPYSTSGDLYAHTQDNLSEAVREWCQTAPTDLRIVLCGYEDEHDSLPWEKTEGRSGGGGGYRNDYGGRRERLWFSPACLGLDEQERLFAGVM